MILLGTAICGAIGAMVRYYIGQLMTWYRNFPLATVCINISGSALLGLLYGLHNIDVVNSLLWQLLGVGLLGAYTTFSTFSYELYTLIKQNRKLAAVIYLLTTLLGGVLAAFCCISLVDLIQR